MRAAFSELAFVHHQDAVGALDCRKPVRDHDRRAPLHHAQQRFAYAKFRFRINAGRGFVQDQVSRVVRQCAREADSTASDPSRGRCRARGSHGRIRGQAADEVEQVHLFGRRFHFSGRIPMVPSRMFSSSVPVNKYGSCRRPRNGAAGPVDRTRAGRSRRAGSRPFCTS